MDHIKESLRSSELFENLTDGELEKITRFCRQKVYEAGETIFEEGDEAKEIFIVEEGRVVLEVTLRLGPGSGRKGSIEVLTKGATFGCSALGEITISTASARCIEKTKLLALGREGLSHFFEEHPDAGYKAMQRLANIRRYRFELIGNTLAHVLSIASHDLKAPLAAVESYHQVMLGGYAGEITEKQKDMLLRSSERIRGLLNLIDNILDISRIDTRELKMEATSLLKVVENVSGTAQPLAKEKGVQLKLEAPKELPIIIGAADRLQQVFTNLLGNAIKFTSDGGIVTLKVSEEDDHILVEVTDTGIGISPEDLPRIFDDFYRGVRVDSTGAGLGLPVSKRIVEAHNGRIWVESPCPETGIGSKFSFTLPKNLATTQAEKEEV